jgi:hypothetical protein
MPTIRTPLEGGEAGGDWDEAGAAGQAGRADIADHPVGGGDGGGEDGEEEMGAALITANWLLMLRSKAIIRTIGPVPLQLFGAVFGVLQVALGLQFVLDAWAML